jgi:WD40 repeat protein
VNCLSFGPKSQQVLATGGNDSKVNIWKVGNASNIWALGQNKSPVECLCFDAEEQYIVSGASNGSIKVFDLNEGRLARNLSGHQVNTSSIQYHPYGEFIVSGSVDCSMKVWDVRNKSCIQTYSGHKKEVTCVRFSPDGRWIASSGKDNQLLIWDLVAGKLLNTIRTDPAYVTSFEFNPAEFVIAAVTSNRNVRLWDMESMEPLNNTPSDSNPIRTMAFSGDGNTIYTATKESLKSYAWETTVKMKGSLEIGWDKIAELRVSADGNTLTAGSFNSNFVSIWSVDLDKVNNSTNTGSDGKYISQQRAIKSKAVPGNRNDKFTKDSINRNSSNIDVDYEADSKSLESLSLDPSTAAKTEGNSPEMHWESEEARNVMESSMSASLQKKLQEHRRQSSERSYAEQSQVDDKENTPSSVDAIQNMLPPSRYIIDSPSSSSAVDRDRRTGSPSDQRNNGSRGRVTPGVRGHTPLKGPSRSAASDRDQSDYMSYADINGDHHSPLKIKGLSSRNASERSLAEAKINREDPTLRAAAKRAAAAAGSSNIDQSNRGM